MTHSSNFKDITGQTFGRLTVIKFIGNKEPPGKQRATWWLCSCSCGNEKEVRGPNLKSGKSTSCGCLQREQSSARLTTHGMSRSSEFESWKAMWDRCTNPKDEAYPRYKDKVPPELWRDFSIFYKELGPKPTPKHTLDRIRNSQPYGPGNCRWATWEEQTRNRSNNVHLCINGTTKILADWVTDLGLSREAVLRLYQTSTPKGEV